ncbi:unnamed protein product [Menidia menidia]|uniref:(Atlantic silverside) hypothetical protein n=1 Tax=Menidia menidia TaxID=238744 RepID=A0A8S4BE71_9TELE|nr:unnamed protein product [Menidia menidia]
MVCLLSLFLCLSLLAFGSVSADTGLRIRAEAGQDSVILPCATRKEKNITAVEWSRNDLDPDYVLLFRNGRLESEGQHPSFMNRVDLQDRQMKDGDPSVILKNVTINDAGTYECRVTQGGGGQRRYTFKTIIHLVVSPPGTQEGGGKGRRGKEGGAEEGGSLGLIVGLTVLSVLCVLVVGVAAWICYRKRACLQRNSQHLPVDQTEPKPV